MKELATTGMLCLLIVYSTRSQPANDDCSGVITINDVATEQTINFDLTGATESLDASCETASSENLDIWYSFTMPFDGSLQVQSVFGLDGISLHDACGGTELSCFKGNNFFYNLTNGATYYLRYSAISERINDFKVQAFEIVANDDCPSATAIADITSAQQVLVDTRGATESLDASCETSSFVNTDVWYSFTMPFDGSVQLSSVFGLDGLSLYETCGGTEIDCIKGNDFFYNLNGGSNYLLRYSAITPRVNDFFIQAFNIVSNDECSDAILIGDISSEQNVAVDTRGATESVDASCENASSTNIDLWYSFTMPYDGSVYISSVFGLDVTSIYDACMGTELGCINGNDFFFDLSNGVDYLLRYAALTPRVGDFNIQAFADVPNDDCSGAITIGDISSAQQVNIDTRGATESLDASCETASFDNIDLWYSFTMPFSGSVQISSVFGLDVISLFDACGGTELGCFAGNDFFYGLTLGNTYLLRYSAVNPRVDNISIQAFIVVANDDCVNAEGLGDVSNLVTVPVDTREATESINALCEDPSFDNKDLWYTFTMPFDGNVELSSVFGFDVLTLFDGCGGSELGCINGNHFFYSLSNGATYILRYASSAPRVDNFSIRAFPHPFNDWCSNPIMVDVSTPQTILTDTRGATESLDASCETALNDHMDLWYSITMPEDNDLEITNVDPVHDVTLFDVCGGAELGCLTEDGYFFSLVNGSTYLLRYATTASFSKSNSFDIGLPSPLPVQLLQFMLKEETGTVYLKWQTATEVNNLGFEILRSADGIIWQKIGWENGAGDANEILDYQFLDQNPPAGLIYYRLKQVDVDGTFEYHQIQSIYIKKDELSTFNIVPNPASSWVQLVGLTTEDVVLVSIYNLSGMMVKKASSNYLLNISDLLDGTYLFRINVGDQLFEKRIVIQK